MFKPLLILGYGGLGREVALLIHQINLQRKEWDLLGFLDDKEIVDSTSFGLPRLGNFSNITQFDSNVCVVLAIGQPKRRQEVLSQIGPNRPFPNLIHPSTVYSAENWSIGDGNVITSHCSFTTGISIGSFNVFNTKITIGHDVTIGDFNVFNPTSCISGHVSIGSRNLFGVNSAVLQSRTVGNDNVLAAGSVLMSSMRSGETWIGVPALKVD